MNQRLLKVSRLEGLTDGIFAIAMTILVLDLRLPSGASTDSLSTLIMSDIAIRLFVYVGSFIILGTLWIAMNFQIGLLEKITRSYLWAHIFYLMTVCIVPFSANLVVNYSQNATAINFFAINLLFASVCQLIICGAAYVQQLNKATCTSEIRHAIIKRILVAPIFYFAAIVVAHWNTNIAFLLLVAPPVIYLVPGKIDTYDK